MEKRKGNVHSPDTVLEDYLNGLESETDSSKNSNNSELEAHKEAKGTSKWAGFIQLFRTKSKRHLGSLDPLNSFKLSKRFSRSMRETPSASKILQNSTVDGDDLSCFKPHWRSFSLSELQTATRWFHQGQ